MLHLLLSPPKNRGNNDYGNTAKFAQTFSPTKVSAIQIVCMYITGQADPFVLPRLSTKVVQQGAEGGGGRRGVCGVLTGTPPERELPGHCWVVRTSESVAESRLGGGRRGNNRRKRYLEKYSYNYSTTRSQYMTVSFVFGIIHILYVYIY